MLERSFLGLLVFLISFVVAIATVYACFRIVMRLTKYSDLLLLKQKNVSVAMVLTGGFVAMAIMMKNTLYPIVAVLQDFSLAEEKDMIGYTILLGRAMAYLMLTFLLSIFSIAGALSVFQKLTVSLAEEDEIANNNVAVGLLLGGVLIAFSIIVESGISGFVNALIPLRDF